VESVLLLQLLDFDIVTLWLDPSRRHLAVCVNGLCVMVMVGLRVSMVWMC
jgi:hypothetical protein